MAPSKHTITQCLMDVGIAEPDFFQECDSLEDEFSALKRCYFAKILKEHPDKGGDAAVFRETRAAFEVLREVYQKGRVRKSTFASYLVVERRGRKKRTQVDEDEDYVDDYDDVFNQFSSSNIPSYDHFAEAAQEEVPGYFVELARSGRSQCVKCKAGKGNRKAKSSLSNGKSSSRAVSTSVGAAPQYIPQGYLRIGSLDDRGGNYGRWNHLECWRVPYRVWSGLSRPDDAKTVLRDLIGMDEVLLTGVSDLDREDRKAFVEHVMDKSHWAKHIRRKRKAEPKPAPSSEEPEPAPTSEGSKRSKVQTEPSSIAATSKALTEAKQRFVVPRPDLNGARSSTALDGKTIVLTGVFPEIGGGAGLNLGKDKVKRMVQSFGGRVTSAVSGKTDYLVVGKEPGRSKVGAARSRGVRMVDLRSLQKLLMNESTFEAIEQGPPPKIESFSAGYAGNRIGN